VRDQVDGRRVNFEALATLGRALDAALFPQTDPALRQATPATESALSIEGVRDF
jgi:hypothetical protein